MEGHNYLHKLGRVKAPPDFEQRVFAGITAKKDRRMLARPVHLALSGGFAALIAVFLVINIFVLPQKDPVQHSGLKFKDIYGMQDTIPINEVMDYSGEIHSIGQDSHVVYILEQVSDSPETEIRF